MTLPLKHPVTALRPVDPRVVEAALASLSYWTPPKAAAEAAVKVADLDPLEQMYAYFG